MTAFEVRGVYRNPDLIDNCNRGRISRPGLDLAPPTGRNGQRVEGKGSFPLDCSQIAVKLHFIRCFGVLVRGLPGVLDSERTRTACVPGNRRGGVG